MLLLRYAAFSFLKAAVSIVFVLANFLSILQLAIPSLHSTLPPKHFFSLLLTGWLYPLLLK